MKVLKRKLKKVHIAKRIFYHLTNILYIATLAFLAYMLLKYIKVERALEIIGVAIFGIWFLIYLLGGLITMLSKKTKTFIFLTIISLLLSGIFGFGGYFIFRTYSALGNMNREVITYSTTLITLKDSNFNDSMTIGMIDEKEDDVEGALAKKLIERDKLTNKIETYEDYNSMIADLLDGKIGACFVPGGYKTMHLTDGGEEESSKEEEYLSKIKEIGSYSEDRANQDLITLKSSKTKTLTEPFTVLVMGVDSAQDGLKANQAFNGDTLILVTFNPNTLTATMLSLPRDLYVPIACNHDRYAKINSSAAYGSSCVIKTVQKLTGIDIDYYVKINFTGVVDLVNALDGVDVEVEEPDFWYDSAHTNQVCESNQYRQTDSANIVCMGLGWQHLDGAQALAYARCRHLYAVSDIARNQHQQQIIEALAKKAKTIKSVNDFNAILDVVSRNIETNITPEQIMSFYDVGKDMLLNSSTDALSIKRTYLEYYSLPVWQRRYGRYTSALGYYQGSLDAITKQMRINLELESETPVKTFSFSYNEEYSTPVIGRGIYTGTRLERMETFIGYDRETANNYCLNHGLTCTFEFIESAEPYGIIVDQEAHEGELLKSISGCTFYMSNGQGAQPVTPTEPEPTDPGQGGETPGGETPGGETPGGETPGGDNPGGETPGGDNPGEVIPEPQIPGGPEGE